MGSPAKIATAASAHMTRNTRRSGTFSMAALRVCQSRSSLTCGGQRKDAQGDADV